MQSERVSDASSGVRVVKQYWRRGEASSYDEGDTRGSCGSPNARRRAALDLDVGDVDQDVHPVLRALLERKRSGSKPGARTDGMRIGLAVEGGSMKGDQRPACSEVLHMGFSGASTPCTAAARGDESHLLPR